MVVLLLLLLFFSFGEPLPCGFPDNTTLSSLVVSNAGFPTTCNGLPVTFIAPQTRLCNQVIQSGASVYYAIVLSNTNAQLNSLTFGVSVTAKNATSLDSAHFVSVFTSTNGCPNVVCPDQQNPFSPGCGYDHTVGYGSVQSVETALQITYMNTANGVYYIMVQGPSDGPTGVAVLFDIQIDDGAQTLARFVPPITVLLFCFVFGAVIAGIFIWKKTHGGWAPQAVLPIVNLDKSVSSRGLLGGESMASFSALPRTTSMNPQSLETVVTLFREQTATINRLTEGSLTIPDPSPPVQQKEEIIEMKEEKKEKKEKKEKDDDDSSSSYSYSEDDKK